MFCSMFLLFLTITIVTSSVAALIDPTEVYNGGFTSGSTEVSLRAATGGAGQSDLVKGEQSLGIPCVQQLA
jgi:hypothetical protein